MDVQQSLVSKCFQTNSCLIKDVKQIQWVCIMKFRESWQINSVYIGDFYRNIYAVHSGDVSCLLLIGLKHFHLGSYLQQYKL